MANWVPKLQPVSSRLTLVQFMLINLKGRTSEASFAAIDFKLSHYQRVKHFLVFAYQVLSAHHAQISRMQNLVEVIDEYLKNPVRSYPDFRAQALHGIELREQPHPASGTLSTADLIAAMLKAIPNL